MIGIICALREEVDGFLTGAERAEPKESNDRAGIRKPGALGVPGRGVPEIRELRIGGVDAVIAAAGLGKVNAAMTAARLVERFDCKALVSAGTAGGLDGVKPMQVVVGVELVQHDYGRSRGRGLLELYRPGDPPLPEYRRKDFALALPADEVEAFRSLTHGLSHVRFGRFASGDTFVNDNATRVRLIELGAIAVDMECAAVAQVAESHGLPWLVAKGISDAASQRSHEDFLQGLAEASRLSAEVVAALLPAVPRRGD